MTFASELNDHIFYISLLLVCLFLYFVTAFIFYVHLLTLFFSCFLSQPENSVAYNNLPKIDKYALFQLENVVASMKDSYENYQFYKIYQVCQRFS
jgi:isoleucyl-tRNA synthetase